VPVAISTVLLRDESSSELVAQLKALSSVHLLTTRFC